MVKCMFDDGEKAFGKIKGEDKKWRNICKKHYLTFRETAKRDGNEMRPLKGNEEPPMTDKNTPHDWTKMMGYTDDGGVIYKCDKCELEVVVKGLSIPTSTSYGGCIKENGENDAQ
jgi:hypothetical protein